MDDRAIPEIPKALEAIRRETDRVGFTLSSDPLTGTLVRVLAASRPGGHCLELGTGTGVGTAWLLDGMDEGARLTTVDSDGAVQEIARRFLSSEWGASISSTTFSRSRRGPKGMA